MYGTNCGSVHARFPVKCDDGHSKITREHVRPDVDRCTCAYKQVWVVYYVYYIKQVGAPTVPSAVI
jgi:hypothetical protein